MGKKKKEDLVKSAEELAKAGAELVGTTIKIAHDVWEKSKIRALRQGISLAKLIENALRKELEDEEEEK